MKHMKTRELDVFNTYEEPLLLFVCGYLAVLLCQFCIYSVYVFCFFHSCCIDNLLGLGLECICL